LSQVTAALEKLREQGRFPSLDELSGRSASGRKASTAAKNKQQQKRLHDEEKMKQRHHAEHNKNNTSKKILVVDDIGLCRRVRFPSLSFRSRRKERALERKRKVPLPRVPCLFGKDNESYFFLLTYSLPLFLSSSLSRLYHR